MVETSDRVTATCLKIEAARIGGSLCIATTYKVGLRE